MLAHNHVSQFLFDKLAINTWTRGLKEPGILMNRFKDARNWNYVGGAITQCPTNVLNVGHVTASSVSTS
jgi:hypothetical protein